jgi:hypothetical protein
MGQLLQLPKDDAHEREMQRRRVERLAEIGATEEDIATELQMPLKRLQKRFRRELERGAVAGKHHVLETLFNNAQSGSNMAATALWVKAKCGWRDTGVPSNSPSIIQAVLEIVR